MRRPDSESLLPLPPELEMGPDRLPQLWGRRGFWQIRLRWAVAPLMLLAVVLGRAAGFEFPLVPILLIAAASPIYNAVFAWFFARWSHRLERDRKLDRFLTSFEVVADYGAMFLLIHFTGGAGSPLAVFLIFHVIIAAIQFRAGKAYQYAALAAGGLWLLLAGEVSGWLPGVPISFRGQPVHLLDRPVFVALQLTVFTATLFLSALMVGRIMRQLRERMGEVARTTAELSRLNDRLSSLYAMVAAIGAERRVEPVLDTVSSELVKVLDVPAVGIKLLSEDGERLRYVAGRGLPEAFLEDGVIELSTSPVNRRVIAGETVVHSRLEPEESEPLRDELLALGIRSAVMVPLVTQERVIGTLGAYSPAVDRFLDDETEFLELAAELVAIAIEDARANEAVENLVQERTRFMLRVAHNLRAPLAAALSMLELLGDDYVGKVSPEQSAYLRRIDSRLRALDETIGELLTIARARDRTREIPDVMVNLAELAAYTRKTFEVEAAKKRIRYEVLAEENLPAIESGTDLLAQVMDNLVSNAIKYTPEGGEVAVRFSRRGPDAVRITVSDTGIGIPAAEQPKLFEEFFRASNAKQTTAAGTGLGLALVQQTVDRHQGRVMIASEEGEGTTVVVDLPAHRR